MKTLEQGKLINVEKLTQQLLRQRSIPQRFKWGTSQQQAEDILTAAYMAEVEWRGRQYVADSEVRANISKIATFLVSEKTKFGIMFCGVCGNGKTTMLRALKAGTECLAKWGYSTQEDDDAKLMHEMLEVEAVDLPALMRQECFKDTPRLIIDDLGQEPSEVVEYGNVRRVASALLEYRYDKRLFTAISTNLTPDQLRDKYGRRVTDRMNEMFEIIIFRNGSYRTN